MESFGFAVELRLRGASASPVAAISSIEVLGPTPLPDGADAAVPNGWVAKVVLPDDGLSSFDPTKISLTLADPGFDTLGNATTVARTVTGTVIVRRQYPNQAQRLNTTSGGVRTVHFALSDIVYQGSTITAVTAAAGYCGPAAAGGVSGVTNSSTLAYPRPRFGWLNLQHERVTGSSIEVEGVAYHEHGRNGQQVACVRFQARDAQGNSSAAVTVPMPALSALQSGGNIVEAWQASLSITGMAQADLCQVNAVVYPWLGDAVLDTADTANGASGTVTAGSAVDVPYGHTPLRFLCDRTGGYGGLCAYVKSGGTATTAAAGVFAGQQDSTALSNAQCFATVATALTALASATGNGARPNAHSDHSGSTVYLMDNGGAAFDHVMSATSTAAGKCWTDIRVDQQAVGTVRLTLTAATSTADLIRLRCPIHITASGTNAAFSGSSPNVRRIAFEGASIGYTATPATPLTLGIGLTYWRNCSFSNVTYTPFHAFGSNRSAAALILGCGGSFTGSGAGLRSLAPYVCVGNAFEGLQIGEFPASHTNAFPHDGGIIANNRFLKQLSANLLANERALTGFARVQNVFENLGNGAGSQGWSIGDGGVVAITNMLSMHNTIPGIGVGGSNPARQNVCYTDAAGTAGVQKTMTEGFDLLHQRNCKSDTFTALSSVTGRTGNWRYRYGVGQIGTVVATGDANAATAADASGANWLGEYGPAGSSWGAGEANVVFTSNLAGSGGAGGGTYTLSGAASAAYARVPAGRNVLRYDLAGVSRRTDGTGAAGAYERIIG